MHNSEAPSADDVRIGNRVVAFYKWIDNMGGDLAGNALYASTAACSAPSKPAGARSSKVVAKATPSRRTWRLSTLNQQIVSTVNGLKPK